MKKSVATLAWVAGLCFAGAECANFAYQVWLNIGGVCLFCAGMVRLAKAFQDEVMNDRV